MEDAVIKVTDLTFLIALVISLYSVYKIFVEMRKPHKETQKKMEEHDEIMVRNSARIIELEESNALICKALLTLIDHIITGNSIENLKDTKNEIRNYLVQK